MERSEPDGRRSRHRRERTGGLRLFGVGVAAIHEALTSRKAANLEEIGVALRAGTKCGTCLPELRSIVARGSHRHEPAHAR